MRTPARVVRTLVLAVTALLFTTSPLLAELPAHLSGMLLDAYNAPIAGAHVYVVLPGDRTIRTTTDATGAFAVLGTNLSAATLILEKPGFVACVSSLHLESGANARAMIHSQATTTGSAQAGDNVCKVVIRHVEAFDRHALD